LLSYYREAGKLVEVDADRKPDQVYERLTAALAQGPPAEQSLRGNKS
jgi:hypothetical protein